MSEFVERLNEAMKNADIDSQAELARRLGLSRGAVSLWFSGTTDPRKVSGEAARKAEEELGVSWEYLITGKRARRDLSPIQVIHDERAGYWVIPRYDVFLALGTGHEPQWVGGEPDQLPGNAFREEFCREMGWHPTTHFSARVEGESMIEAHLLPGWSIVVDARPEARQTITEDEIYALRENGSGLICKYLEPTHDGGLRIISANRSHPRFREPRQLSPEEAEHIEILGRVVHVQGMLGRRR